MKTTKTLLALGIASAMFFACKKDGNNDPITGDPPTPRVTGTSPVSNATGSSRNTTITVSFNEVMDPTTITDSTFTLKQGNTEVPGSISYSGTTAEFTPNSALAANTVYTSKISTGVRNIVGKALSVNTDWSFTTGGNTSPIAVVNLGSAINYAILAKTAINNVPTSIITGDLGLSPAATSYITGLSLTNNTGFATSAQVTGNVYAADMVAPTSTNLTTAIGDMHTAYENAAGRLNPDFLELGGGNIGGKTLSPGLYKWTTTVTAPTAVVISGSANDIWIFQTSGGITVSSAVNFTLAGGAQAKNVFWQVAGQVSLGTTSSFQGIILSKTSIVLGSGATLSGRALAQTAVILDSNVVTEPQ